jgi:thioredoxin-like negative regulator of GroEL
MPSRDEPLVLGCLCAAWCRLCAGYAETITAVAAEFPAVTLQWIDIEDDAELVGELDIETFPTLVLASASQILFAGALQPQPETLRRLLRSGVRGQVVGGDVAEFDALAAELWRRAQRQASERAR